MKIRSKNKLTIKDIAAKLKIAPSTVSKALRDSDDISSAMKEKVKNAAKEMQYRPNILARSLINRRTKLLGILIPDLRISFFSEAVRGMYEEASKKGYECLLLIHDEDTKQERKKMEFLSDIGVDGILLNSVGNKENFSLYKDLDEEGIKIICWDRKLKQLPFKSVVIDDIDASFKLTSKLIKEGRKNILFLGPNTGIAVAPDRFKGYKLALKKHGIPFRNELVLETFRDVKDSYKKMLALIDKGVKIDGVISIGGLITFGAGKAIKDRKMRIPEDIIIGEFGDNDIVARLGVPYYSVNQNPFEMGKASTDLLINLIESHKTYNDFDDIIISSQIIERKI